MSDLWGSLVTKLEPYTLGQTSAKDLNYAVQISLKHKYIFVETPKVACSTIKLTLQRMELDDPEFTREDFEDLHRRDYSPLLRLQQLPNFESYLGREDFFTFCFVRNPYDRLLSCYLDKIIHPTNFKKKVLVSMGLDEKNIDHPISFEEFVSVVETQTPIEMDYHWRPQAYLTCRHIVNYNHIGKLESFEDDFQRIGMQLSPEFEEFYAPEFRHKTDAHNLLEKYYTNDLYTRVFEIYEVDFMNFSYDR